MKSNACMTFAYDAPSRTLGWLFSDGSTLEYVHADVAPVDSLTIPALVHGFKQKIADGGAISRNAETGKPATVADKRDAMARIVENLKAGDWYAERKGGGAIGGLLAVAIANVDGSDVEKVREYLKGKTQKQRDAIGANKKYAGELAKLRKARVVDLDVSAEMAELDAMK